MTEKRIQAFVKKLIKLGIDTKLIEYGDGHAGHIQMRMVFDKYLGPWNYVAISDTTISEGA